jgi:LPS-assembly lipoprotein
MNLRAVLLLGLGGLLAGCGFHAAGTRPLPEPLKRVRIDMVQPYRVSEPPVETSLRDRLARRGAKIETKDGDGVTLIRLSELRESREVLSVGPDGKALEYELILRVRYEVRTGQQVWVPPSIIEARRDYSFNAQQVLPKEQEAERLREYLEDELAELLLLRIEAASARAAQSPPAPAATPATESPPGTVSPGPTPPGAGAPAAAPATSPDAPPAAAPDAPASPPAADPAPAATPAPAP